MPLLLIPTSILSVDVTLLGELKESCCIKALALLRHGMEMGIVSVELLFVLQARSEVSETIVSQILGRLDSSEKKIDLLGIIVIL